MGSSGAPAVVTGPAQNRLDLAVAELDAQEAVNPLERLNRVALELLLGNVAELMALSPWKPNSSMFAPPREPNRDCTPPRGMPSP